MDVRPVKFFASKLKFMNKHHVASGKRGCPLQRARRHASECTRVVLDFHILRSLRILNRNTDTYVHFITRDVYTTGLVREGVAVPPSLRLPVSKNGRGMALA